MKICHDCGQEREALHRHHIIPKSQGGSNDPSNLVGLCANCHENRHHGPFGGTLGQRLSHSESAQIKRSASMKARWADPQYRQRIIVARAKARTPESEMRRIAAARKYWEDPEHRERQAALLREINARPERNRKISETNKRLGRKPPPPTLEGMAYARSFLNTPTAKARWNQAMAEVRADPAVAKQRQRTMKNKWLDPEYRAKVLEARGQGGLACKRGHPMSGDNLYIDGRGRRVCKACKQMKSNESRARRRGSEMRRGGSANRPDAQGLLVEPT